MKKRPFPRTGVGQTSLAAVLIGAPRFTGAPQEASVLTRCATQMSVAPSPPNRSDAKYRLSPSGDCIEQPSREVVFTLPRPSCDGSAHAENCLAATSPGMASMAVRPMVASSASLRFMVLLPYGPASVQ